MRLDELPLVRPTTGRATSEWCGLESKSGKPFVVRHYIRDGVFGRTGDWLFVWVGTDDPVEKTSDLLMAQCLLHDYLSK